MKCRTFWFQSTSKARMQGWLHRSACQCRWVWCRAMKGVFDYGAEARDTSMSEVDEVHDTSCNATFVLSCAILDHRHTPHSLKV